MAGLGSVARFVERIVGRIVERIVEPRSSAESGSSSERRLNPDITNDTAEASDACDQDIKSC
jgi:hypothetical protein